MGRRGEVYPETPAVDGKLDTAKRAREAREARRHAQQRGAGDARQTRGSRHRHGHGHGYGNRHWRRGGGGSAAWDGQRPARARRGWGHELRRERLLGPAVGASELGEPRLHLQRLAAPRAPHLDEFRRRRHDGGSSGRVPLITLGPLGIEQLRERSVRRDGLPLKPVNRSRQEKGLRAGFSKFLAFFGCWILLSPTPAAVNSSCGCIWVIGVVKNLRQKSKLNPFHICFARHFDLSRDSMI